ncbi:DUF397 domain-containing protein [Streptomyces sp. NPDC002589]|uniref:DUF397 domain-containing protein n=1 Tax=Streptomyces sp. NPDC002589 TaxID=3154420 RepID=UPI003332A466
MTEVANLLAGLSARMWFKCSYSGGEGNECVEVARSSMTVWIRDSKVVGQRGLNVSAHAFTTFINGLKDSVTPWVPCPPSNGKPP